MRCLVLAAVLGLLAACGQGVSADTPTPTPPPTEYVTEATVLESPEHGPQLCFAVATSYPPQCGGADVRGWSWSAVDDEESASGTTWGVYRVHGTYADGALTLTREPSEPEPFDEDAAAEESRFTTPCPEPAGGWFPEGRTKIGERDRSRAIGVARRDASFGDLWVDQRPVGEPTEETMNDPARLILNVSVTGGVAAMQSRLREVWGGALCVSEVRHTNQELKRITQQVDERAGSLLLSSSWGDDRVDLDVLVDVGGRLQQELDDEHGPGTVKVTSALKAVPPES